MIIKKKTFVKIVIIGLSLFYGHFTQSQEDPDKEVIKWFNSWTSDLIIMREISHEKINKITLTDIKSEDYFNEAKMKELKLFMEQIQHVELWKIDTITFITKKWYQKIDPMLSKYLNEGEREYLKNYLLIGIEESNEFRPITNNYFNDYLSLINFLLSKNCVLSKQDEQIYNQLIANLSQSGTKYNESLNTIYNIRFKRVKEFSEHFESSNIKTLIKQIDGVY